jgi:hypothetical protein
MRWFENNFAKAGRFLDERIEGLQDAYRRLSDRPSYRIARTRERITDWFRDRFDRARELIEDAKRSLPTHDGPVPGFVWPLVLMCVVASAGLTYVVTTSMSAPAATPEELELQRTVRKRASGEHSPFEAFVRQPQNREPPKAAPKAGTKDRSGG